MSSRTLPWMIVWLGVLAWTAGLNAQDTPATDEFPSPPEETSGPTQTPPTQPPAGETTTTPPGQTQPGVTPPPGTPPETEENTPGEDLITEAAFLANISVDHADGKYKEGERMTARFKVERKAHVYLLYHQVDNSCRLLFPNNARPDNLLEPMEEVSIPGQGEKFRFRVRRPFGVEYLQIIACTEPVPELKALDLATLAPEVTAEAQQKIKERIEADPTKFGEHRVRLETFPADAPPPPRVAKRAGLFVGISLYEDGDASLPLSKESVEHVCQTFIDHGGMSPENALVLANENATKAKIEQAFVEWLPSVTEPGDFVFFYYNAHGGTVKDIDGDEIDGFDETLTVYDNKLPAFSTAEEYHELVRKRQITDDVLTRWLQELPGRHIVLVLDTCHGGGFGSEESMNVEKSLNNFLTEETARVKDISQLDSIVICTSHSDELTWAFEEKVGEKAVEIVPHHLRQVLSTAPHPVTARQAYDVLKAVIVGRAAAGGRVQAPTYTDNALTPIVIAP